VWQGNKILIVSFANADFLFPAVILADDQHADLFFDQQIDNSLTGGVKIVIDAASAQIG